ncbi:MAG: UDP-N-acetylglucosamine--N-acetylmuramyl-(pentapeptide) pyrophosphoryl-undecaprenol N-acetylglucosamine transferase [Candidatus Dependentiae bacterium]|nr:UDP-N-acetylglucosamine--N-acetylmuramyl-(pentapeptide) pyrophosphoryl-undecaprenol N-acetylglucosamine transferase [Candidatus Dependentiae bacterium]
MEQKIELKGGPTICFVAGRSGGHIIPCLTRARELVKRYPHYQALFFTTHVPLDKKIIEQSDNVRRHVILTLENFPYKRFYRYPIFILQFIWAFLKSLYWLKKTKPVQVVTTGGYVALPVCFAARLLKIPVELQLLDVVPGKALALLTSFAQSIAVCFKQSIQYLPKHKCMVTDYPVRFSKQDKQIQREDARKAIGLDADKYTIFVLGGSQGSLFLNQLFKKWIQAVPHLHTVLQVIHQTGSQDTDEWKNIYAELKIPAFVFDYYTALQYCYRSADLVLCRSGAGTLFETRFFNVSCITIPLESATTSHQKDNAYAFAQQFQDRVKVLLQTDLETASKNLHNLLNINDKNA